MTTKDDKNSPAMFMNPKPLLSRTQMILVLVFFIILIISMYFLTKTSSSSKPINKIGGYKTKGGCGCAAAIQNY
jgi:preprotein translocase subunit SecG